jgi:hypothetical protein
MFARTPCRPAGEFVGDSATVRFVTSFRFGNRRDAWISAFQIVKYVKKIMVCQGNIRHGMGSAVLISTGQPLWNPHWRVSCADFHGARNIHEVDRSKEQGSRRKEEIKFRGLKSGVRNKVPGFRFQVSGKAITSVVRCQLSVEKNRRKGELILPVTSLTGKIECRLSSFCL